MNVDSSSAHSGEQPVSSRILRWRVVIAAIAVFVVFFQLGGRGLNEPDEGRYAEAGREMAASGDYITPHLNGAPHYTKPPLTYWLIAASLRTFGVNEFAARLPAALAALGTLLAVYLIGRRAIGEAGALWAVVVLLSSLLFLVIARLITTDMLLTCWVTWSVWALWRWSEDGLRWRSAVWFFVFLGLGLITKGPVATLLSLFALAGLRWRNPELRLRHLCWGRGLLVTLAIALPWFIAVTWGHPELWGYFLGKETVGRVLTDVHGRAEPWWFFLPVLAGGMLPWTPWLGLAFAMRRLSLPTDAKLVRLCLIWAGAGLLLFTLSRSKLPTYVLPLLPALALLVALTLVRLPALMATGMGPRAVPVCFGVSLVALLGGAVALAVVAPREYELPLPLACVPLLVVVVLSLLLGVAWRRRGVMAGAGLLVAATLGLAVSVLALLPKVERHLGGKAPVKYLARSLMAADPEQRAQLVVFGKLHYGLPFYLQRTVLWYNPSPVMGASKSAPNPVEAHNMITDVRELAALLAGTSRVICIADRKQSEHFSEEFGLRELQTDADDRHALLVVDPARASPATSPVSERIPTTVPTK